MPGPGRRCRPGPALANESFRPVRVVGSERWQGLLLVVDAKVVARPVVESVQHPSQVHRQLVLAAPERQGELRYRVAHAKRDEIRLRTPTAPVDEDAVVRAHAWSNGWHRLSGAKAAASGIVVRIMLGCEENSWVSAGRIVMRGAVPPAATGRNARPDRSALKRS